MQKTTGVTIRRGTGFEALLAACQHVGNKGRVATVPDIVDARLACGIDSRVWLEYFTTMTGEYVGCSAGGIPIAIIAHGIGPLTSPQRLRVTLGSDWPAYPVETAEFRALENGTYGPVKIIEIRKICKRSARQVQRFPDAAEDPYLEARLGTRTEEYLRTCLAASTEFLSTEGLPGNDCVISNDNPYCRQGKAYTDGLQFDLQMDKRIGDKRIGDGAWGYLIMIGPLTDSSHFHRGRLHRSLIHRLNVINELDHPSTARFVAVQNRGKLQEVVRQELNNRI